MTRDEWIAFYRALGLVAIPLRPREKRPLRAGWQKLPADEQWRAAPVNANLGVLTGAASGGLVVLDFDTEDGPFEVLGLRPRELAALTMVVRTARGWHVYAKSKDLRTHSPVKGLDVRGEGAMVVAPPSVHPSGVEYAMIGVARVAELSLFGSLPDVDPSDQVGDECEIDISLVEDLIALQAPKLQASWRSLKTGNGTFDRSRADFAVARCLWEAGYSPEAVARVLCALPGSKARERGSSYALRTAIRASGHGREKDSA